MKWFDFRIRSNAARVSAWLIAETGAMSLFDHLPDDDAVLSTKRVYKQPDDERPYFRFLLDGTLSGSYFKGAELVKWEREEPALVCVDVLELSPDLVEAAGHVVRDEQHLTYPYGLDRYMADLEQRFVSVFESELVDLARQPEKATMPKYLDGDKSYGHRNGGPIAKDKLETVGQTGPNASMLKLPATLEQPVDRFFDLIERPTAQPVRPRKRRGRPPEDERRAEINRLADVEELTYPLIAERLSIAVSTVKYYRQNKGDNKQDK